MGERFYKPILCIHSLDDPDSLFVAKKNKIATKMEMSNILDGIAVAATKSEFLPRGSLTAVNRMSLYVIMVKVVITLSLYHKIKTPLGYWNIA